MRGDLREGSGVVNSRANKSDWHQHEESNLTYIKRVGTFSPARLKSPAPFLPDERAS